MPLNNKQTNKLLHSAGCLKMPPKENATKRKWHQSWQGGKCHQTENATKWKMPPMENDTNGKWHQKGFWSTIKIWGIPSCQAAHLLWHFNNCNKGLEVYQEYSINILQISDDNTSTRPRVLHVQTKLILTWSRNIVNCAPTQNV